MRGPARFASPLQEQVQLGAEIGLEGTLVIAPYALGGGFPKGPGVVATSMFARTAARAALSPTARKLAREMDALLTSGVTKDLEAEGVEIHRCRGSDEGQHGRREAVHELRHDPRPGHRLSHGEEFEDAAVAVGRANGAKTVTVDVGVIIDEGWKKILTARGYEYVAAEGAWIKLIKVE